MKVWLTFDDGPSEYTGELLTILQQFQISATFFVIGRNVELYPGILEETYRRGHRIGNHTFNHPRLTGCSANEIKHQILATETLIRPFITGSQLLFRPPYGDYDETVRQIAVQLGYQMVLWNVDPCDWSELYQPTEWISSGLRQISGRGRSIVLNHDTLSTTVENLVAFIEGILRIGGEFGAHKDLTP